MALIIGISGKAGAGKTTLATLLRSRVKDSAHFAFADALKWKVKQDFGFNDKQVFGEHKDEICRLRDNATGKYLTPRDVLIRVGQFYRSFDELFWVRACFARINGSTAHNDVALISDVRFQNEANFIRQNKGLMVRVERASELLIHGPHEKDISETDLDEYQHDLTVKANDIGELRAEADRIANIIAIHLVSYPH